MVGEGEPEVAAAGKKTFEFGRGACFGAAGVT